MPLKRLPARTFDFLTALALVAAGAGWGAPATVAAQAAPADEYRVKAVFLFNFAQFVEWPPEAFPSPEAPLVIGLLGTDPFGSSLDETVRGENVNGHPLVIRRFARVGDVADCHILFVGRDEGGRLAQILGALKSREILTVGEIQGFAERGGMIGFVTDRNRIRLAVNVEASDDSRLKLSSKLLRAATIVSTGGA